MTSITEGNNLGDLLKYEVSNLYSRDQITVAIALFTIIRTDRNMLLACYSHKHISYRIRTIIRKAIKVKILSLVQ